MTNPRAARRNTGHFDYFRRYAKTIIANTIMMAPTIPANILSESSVS